MTVMEQDLIDLGAVRTQNTKTIPSSKNLQFKWRWAFLQMAGRIPLSPKDNQGGFSFHFTLHKSSTAHSL